MSKDKISDYSATANSNTDIGGINIDEGCAPSGINDAIRTLMKQLKDWQSGSQDVYIHPAGSASVPSITATGDTNTGLFFPAADTIALTTGGTERARVDSSGNFGVGTSSPNFETGTGKGLHVNYSAGLGAHLKLTDSASGSAATDGFDIYTYNTNGYIENYEAGSIIFRNGGSERARIDASGNLGIGTTSPATKLAVTGGIAGTAGLNISGAGWGVLPYVANSTVIDNNSGQTRFFATGADATTDGSFLFYTSQTDGGANERMRITSSGELLVGTTSASITSGLGTKIGNDSAGAFVSTVTSSTTNGASFAYTYYSTGAGAYRFYVGAGGTVFATSTTISSLSDARYKENIRDLDAGLSEIMALQPRKFDWKEGKGANIKNARGFIAQEFEQVFPDMIDEWRDEAPEGEAPYKSVRADLIPVLVKAIQEQQAIITQLQADVAALKGQA